MGNTSKQAHEVAAQNTQDGLDQSADSHDCGAVASTSLSEEISAWNGQTEADLAMLEAYEK